jgi:hypothetical protein
MDADEALDELFAAAREEFTALRDTWVKRARSDGDDDLAGKLQRVRRPTVAAWLVNQVSRAYPGETAELADIGEALRQAHQTLAGDRLRSLSRQRHDLIQVLSGHARSLAADAGHPATDTALDQAQDIWTSAVADEEVADAVRAGRLSAAPTPGSSEDWLTAATITPLPSVPPRPATPRPAPSSRPREAPSRPDARERAESRRAVQEATRARDSARKAAAGAEREAAQAEQEAENAADTVVELRDEIRELSQRLNDLRDRATQANEDEREARRQATAARKAAAAADRAVTEAEQHLAPLEDP